MNTGIRVDSSVIVSWSVHPGLDHEFITEVSFRFRYVPLNTFTYCEAETQDSHVGD